MQTKLKIDGMHCGGCARAVGNVLGAVEGVTEVSIDLEHGWAEIQSSGPVPLETLRMAVEDAGYHASIV
jgi:copper chaperone CopZ